MNKSILEIQSEIIKTLESPIPKHFIHPFASYIYDFNQNIYNLANDRYLFNNNSKGFINLNKVLHIDQNPSQILNIKFLKREDDNSMIIHCGPNNQKSNLSLSIDHPSNVHVVASDNGFNRDLSLKISAYIINNIKNLENEFQKKLNENQSVILNISEIVKVLNIKGIDVHNFLKKDKLYNSADICNIIMNNNDMFTLIHDLNFEKNLNLLNHYNNKNKPSHKI